MNSKNKETPEIGGNLLEGNDQYHLASEPITSESNETSATLSKSAEYYGARGWKVFPVHGITPEGNCTCGSPHDGDESQRKLKGKHPAIREWNQKATNESRQIAEWWAENPHYNIGLACRESEFVVADTDPRNGGIESLDKLEIELNVSLPHTVESLTGVYEIDGKEVRGRHFFMHAPEGIAFRGNLASKKEAENLAGIDIKHNGYVILPPSKHASGVSYEWREGHDPATADISEVPSDLLEVIAKGKERSRGTSELISEEKIVSIRESSKETTPYGAKALDREMETVANCTEGGRNNQLFQSGAAIGELIAGGHIAWDDGINGLTEAAQQSGLDDAEIEQVLLRPEGAIVRGLSNPRGPRPLPEELLKWAQSHSEQPSDSKPRDPSILERANILNWEELFSGPPVEEEWLVDGIICAERGHALYSDAGLGKSLLMREIGACLASGKSALGFEPKEPMRVLYLDYENNPHGDTTRSLRDMGFSESDLDNLFVASFPEFDPLDTQKGGQQLMELVNEINPRLVIIDTVSRVIDGDENSNDTWNHLYKHMGKLLKRSKVAHVRLDHEGKNASNGARGGSAKRGDVDLVWRYSLIKRDKSFKLVCEKKRMAIETDEFVIDRLTSPQLHHRVRAATASDQLNWPELWRRNDLFEQAIELIEANFSTETKVPGQKVAWEKLKRECERKGISRELLNEAIRALKSPWLYEVNDEGELHEESLR